MEQKKSNICVVFSTSGIFIKTIKLCLKMVQFSHRTSCKLANNPNQESINAVLILNTARLLHNNYASTKMCTFNKLKKKSKFYKHVKGISHYSNYLSHTLQCPTLPHLSAQ